MFPKEAETCTAPHISLDVNIVSVEDEEISFERERGVNFLDSMKQNVPSIARMPSPKLHRKHHHRHHHKHGSRSPNTSRKKLETRMSYIDGSSSNFLTVEDHQLRARSYSDSSLESSEHRQKQTQHQRRISPLASPTYEQHRWMNDNSEDIDGKSPEIGSFQLDDDSNEFMPDPTIKRDFINGDINPTISGTITKRKAELVRQVHMNENQMSKKKSLKMIDQLIEQCHSNYQTIQTEVDFVFSRLHAALDTRKREILEEASVKCKNKIENLNKSKKNFLNSKSMKSNHGSDNESEHSTPSTPPSRGESENHDECLQSNGILEPWKTGDEVNNQDNIVYKVAEELSKNNDVLTDFLDEGNLAFIFNEESMEMFNTIGQINEKLSSPQFSFTKRLQNGMALVGETVRFEVHTRNKLGEVTFDPKDEIECNIFSLVNETVDITNDVSLHRSLSNSRICAPLLQSTLIKYYTYNFTPRTPGKYEIRIRINNVELKNSPFVYFVYPKVELTFRLNSPEEKKDMKNYVAVNPLTTTPESRRKKGMVRRESSEDSDWSDNNWIVQKGDKSSLLRSARDLPSYLYAAPAVKGFCAWKIRVTSACQSIVISIGVGTRSGIPDIDEHFACEFDVDKNKNKHRNEAGRVQMRRTSSFTRVSLTYDVLLSTDERIVRVISELDEEDKTVTIDPKISSQFDLYPFISMVHRHDNCSREVCPRPQITLL